jgi:low affinity Fe/Cu permease
MNWVRPGSSNHPHADRHRNSSGGSSQRPPDPRCRVGRVGSSLAGRRQWMSRTSARAAPVRAWVSVAVRGYWSSVDHATRHEAERVTWRPRRFARTSRRLTRWVGSLRWVLTLGLFGIAWLVVGAVWGFARWWELVITVGLPFITLLLLALIQHTQNHDSNAIELKLDELLTSLDPASDAMVRIEEASEEDLEVLQAHFGARSEAARQGPN